MRVKHAFRIVRSAAQDLADHDRHVEVLPGQGLVKGQGRRNACGAKINCRAHAATLFLYIRGSKKVPDTFWLVNG